MLISKNILSQFVTLPKKLTPQELMSKITVASVEVEGIRDLSEEFKGVIVAEILEVKKHPNADKLQLALVDTGKEKLEIVCGAPNIAVGQKVPLATLGTYLAAMKMTIELRPVRGVNSNGMLCAADELGLGEDHAGILILDSKLKVGTPFAEAMGMDDWILEVDNKSMTHRPDMWGHLGFAREVGAVLGAKFKGFNAKKINAESAEKLHVVVEDTKACPRYMGVIIDGIEVGPSPAWLKNKLEILGQRSINNIVDITNYVMFELGQSLHAFDFEKIDGHLTVRKAKNGEKLVALDEVEYSLTADDLVIADSKRPLIIAGIKGGKESGVSDSTNKIILESANFEHVTIRKTSMRLALRSEASARYEKSLDPNLSELCLSRAIELILEVCPKAKVVSKVVDIKNFKLDQGPIKTSVDYLQKRIGAKIPKKEIVDILKSLGFKSVVSGQKLSVTIPTWRATKDVTGEHDIVEEVARIHGYNNLKPVLPNIGMRFTPVDLRKELEEKIKDMLALGFDMAETYNYSFTNENDIKLFGQNAEDFIRVLSPQSADLSLLRTSMIPNLALSAASNSRFFEHFNLFEVGSVYLKDQKGAVAEPTGKEFLPKQEVHVAGTVYDKGNKDPFFTVKNIVEGLLHRLHFRYSLEFAEQCPAWANGNRFLFVRINDKTVGYISELSQKVQNKIGLKERVGIFDLDLDELAAQYSTELRYVPIPKFPAIDLDISIMVDANTYWQKVQEIVRAADKDLIRDIILFDIYQGEGMEAGKKSLAFRVTYRSDDKTLELKEADLVHNKIKEALKKELGAVIR